MSDYLSGDHHKQPWLNHCSDQSFVHQTPFGFNNRSNYFDHSANIGVENFVRSPLTTNMRIGEFGRGGEKAYFRFHGGIGDGRGSIAYRASDEQTALPPLQLFEALNPFEMLMKAPTDGYMKHPMLGSLVPTMEASGGTGVYLPVYPKNISSTKGKRVCGGCGCGCGGQMKQDDIFVKPFASDDAVEEEECKDIDEIPIELLLPAEWTY